MQNGDEALPSIILAGQTDYHISTTGCAYYNQLIYWLDFYFSYIFPMFYRFYILNSCYVISFYLRLLSLIFYSCMVIVFLLHMPV